MAETPQATGEQKSDHKPAPTWIAPAAIIALGLIAIFGLVFLSGKSDFGKTKVIPAVVHTATVRPVAPHKPAGPRFDTVRVDAGGNAVIAGRATPGATVTITANGKAIGTIKADQHGSFAFVTSIPLPAGGQQLALSETSKSGETLASARNVTVSVPKAPSEGVLAVLTGGPKTPSQVLSGQGPKPGTLGIGSVDYDSDGHAVIAGTAKPGAQVSLSLGGVALGTAMAGADGRWVLHTNHLPTRPGTFKLQSMSKTGAVDATMQTAYAPRATGTLAAGHVVVTRGQCLWLIARKRYGKGAAYAMIYRANEASISNPNLIYPGERLTLPKLGSTPAAPVPPVRVRARHDSTIINHVRVING